MTSPSDSRAALLRYLAVGVGSIVIDVGLLYTLHRFAGVGLALATTVAFAVSLVFNFTLNRMGMSSSGTQGVTRHLFRFCLLVAMNLVITVVVVTAADHIGVSYLVAKLAVVAASTGWNFVLYRRWVFTPVESRTSRRAQL